MRSAVAIAMLVFVGCFVESPVTKVARGGLEIRKADVFEAPLTERSTVVVAPGDFVLAGPSLRVVVGGLEREGDARGAVLEAVHEGVSSAESLVLYAPRLYVGGIQRRIDVERMFILERGGQPVLRTEGVVALSDRRIMVARELTFGRVEGTLSVTTRTVTPYPDGQRDVRLGARLAWGGPRPFVPGLGEVVDESWHRADWVGSEGATGSVVFGYHDGPLSMRAVYEHRAQTLLLLHTDVAQGQSFDLVTKQPHYEKTVVALSASAIAASVRRFGMWRGRPYPEAWAFLPYRPVGSEVELRDGDARILLHARPDEQGHAILPLTTAEGEPPTRFVAMATAFGHAPSDPFEWKAGETPSFTLQIPEGGRIRIRARDAEGKAPLPVRVRLSSLEQAPPPSLGPDYRASGAGDTLILLTGEGSIDVPPGRYRVIVGHGPEWSMRDAEVDVTETFSPRVDALLEHQVDPSGWIACDLHVHAAPSPDSQVTLEDRLATLLAEGVRFAVPTDHNHVTDYAPVASAMALRDFSTVTGVEITTLAPIYGHFNAYPYPLDPERPNNGAPEVNGVEPGPLLRSVRAADPDIVVQVNHPRAEGGIGYFDQMSFDARTGAADPRFSAEFDAIEVWNGFDLARRERVDQVFGDWLAMLARGQRVVATGSSDSHQVRYQLAGYPRTYALVPNEAASDGRAIVRAIKAGATFVTSGPFIEATAEGGGPGTTVQAREGKVTLAVRVQAADWIDVDTIEVFVGGERTLERAIPKAVGSAKKRRAAAVRIDLTNLTLPIAQDTFIVVRVSGATPNDVFFGRANVLPLAFTNPIFVDADGDGRTPWTQ